MQITLNGELLNFEQELSLASLLEKYELSPQKVAIELNLTIIAAEEFANVMVRDGDKLEIVEFVGGG